MKVLIACEFSGIIREAFRARGHKAYSCDILPTERGLHLYHYHMPVQDVLAQNPGVFDLMIAHPPCRFLAVSGNRWNKTRERRKQQKIAIEFVRYLMAAKIERIAIENPVSIISSRIRKPDQTIQPWMFGHGEIKRTCLWLKNLPPLVPTKIVTGRVARVHRAVPGEDRWKERSRTLQGIADAMAEQWGCL